MTINFLLWVAILVGALAGYGENIFGKLIDLSDIKALLAVAQNDGGVIVSMLIGFALMVTALLILSLIGVAGALIRHYGYRLTVDGETYRREGGLLSRHDESLKRHKIQAVVCNRVIDAGSVLRRARRADAGILRDTSRS